MKPTTKTLIEALRKIHGLIVAGSNSPMPRAVIARHHREIRQRDGRSWATTVRKNYEAGGYKAA